MPLNIMNVQQRLGEVVLTDHESTASVPASTSWLDKPEMVEQVRNLKDLAFGNCRLLYGSEKFKFYDVVICSDEDDHTFCAILTCNQDGATKLLPKSISGCAVKAVGDMVNRLQKDTALLFMSKYDVGSELRDQQGYTDPETGRFELSDSKQDHCKGGPVDDTANLGINGHGKRSRGVDSYVPAHAPTGPRGDRPDGKRARRGDPRMNEDNPDLHDLY